MSKEFFNPNKGCPDHATLHHADVTSIRCEHCEKFNPNWNEREPSVKPEKKFPPSFPRPGDDVHELSDESPDKKSSSAPPRPSGRSASAQHIPGLITGVGEKGRREASAAVTAAKIKSGYTSGPDGFNFMVGVAHHNPTTDKWKKAPATWMKSEENRKVTLDTLLESLLAQVRKGLDRAVYKQWLVPSESGTWLVGYYVTSSISKDSP